LPAPPVTVTLPVVVACVEVLVGLRTSVDVDVEVPVPDDVDDEVPWPFVVDAVGTTAAVGTGPVVGTAIWALAPETLTISRLEIAMVSVRTGRMHSFLSPARKHVSCPVALGEDVGYL